jgi:2-hydroxychromene-2-carboxylate isomerase
MGAPVFYFDLGSPYAYLTAERIDRLFDAVDWQPILLGAVLKRLEKASWALGPARVENIGEIERRAARYGLPPFRVVPSWPSDYLFAMRVATAARQIGAVERFALAAFRSAFAAGRDLSTPETVLEAAAAAGLDRTRLKAEASSQTTKDALRDATEQALALGVGGVPTLAIGGRLYFGDDRLDEAAAAARV